MTGVDLDPCFAVFREPGGELVGFGFGVEEDINVPVAAREVKTFETVVVEVVLFGGGAGQAGVESAPASDGSGTG